jgi:hypothetical protein
MISDVQYDPSLILERQWDWDKGLFLSPWNLCIRWTAISRRYPLYSIFWIKIYPKIDNVWYWMKRIPLGYTDRRAGVWFMR